VLCVEQFQAPKERDKKIFCSEIKTLEFMISIIVSTYNRPDALRLVLLALAEQSIKNFEVIVADDGSANETKQVIEALKSKVDYKIVHIWHEDQGFRVATIRNKSVAIAKGDYLIFLDGDSIPRVSFVRKHQKLAEHNYFVAGNRMLLSSYFTSNVILKQVPVQRWGAWGWLKSFCCGQINRFFPVLPLGVFYLRRLRCRKWKGVKTCNLGMWKKDFFAVNGFDESFSGWGYEDSDLVIRLMRNQVLRKDGHFSVPVFHLWHPENSRTRERVNYQKLKEIESSMRVKSAHGVDQYM
jgi:glycosyltransferase involved in cell wall biosynthesis